MIDTCSSCGNDAYPGATIPRHSTWRGPEEPLCWRCFTDVSCIEVRRRIRERRKMFGRGESAHGARRDAATGPGLPHELLALASARAVAS